MDNSERTKYNSIRGKVGEVFFEGFCLSNGDIQFTPKHGAAFQSDKIIDYNLEFWEDGNLADVLFRVQVKTIHPSSQNFQLLDDGQIKLTNFYPNVLNFGIEKAISKKPCFGFAIAIIVLPNHFLLEEHPSQLLQYKLTNCLEKSELTIGSKLYLYSPQADSPKSYVTLSPEMMIEPKDLTTIMKKLIEGTYYV